jgi:hypothetical protein
MSLALGSLPDANEAANSQLAKALEYDSSVASHQSGVLVSAPILQFSGDRHGYPQLLLASAQAPDVSSLSLKSRGDHEPGKRAMTLTLTWSRLGNLKP